MNELIPIYDTSQLSQRKVYQIQGTLYRFIGQCVWAKIEHPQWNFEPLPGQRKTATLKLNQKNVREICEVPNMIANQKTQVVGQVIQQSLF